MRLIALFGLVAACAGANGEDRPDARSSTLPDARPGFDARPAPDAPALSDATPAPDAATSSADAAFDAAAPDAASGAPDAEPGTDAGVIAYSHTIAIDGANDFSAADERFATTTGGFFTYVSWDSTYLYIGVEGADVAANDSQRWVLIYVGGNGGSTTGVSYNTQQPSLPFAARYHVRWRSDNSFTEAQEYSAGWSALAWDFTGDVYQSGTYLELRIPRADIGSPTTVPLHISFINEASGGEWTFAGTPSTSFTDSYNPSYGAYYQFDLGAATAPNAYSPSP